MAGRLLYRLLGGKDEQPVKAYDLWAKDYDLQPNNLMLALDEVVFSELLDAIDIKNKTIIDVGCGTGRHWKKIMSKEPDTLTGYDVSQKMLEVLEQKIPGAITHLQSEYKLVHSATNTIDAVISTLTIAHIQKPEQAMAEWNRVLKPGGFILITDYHPAALQKGGKRTFMYNGGTISVKNYIHSLEKVLAIGGQLNWQRIRLVEKAVDETLKPYYERENALDVYESFKGVPVCYGLLFNKKDVI